MISECVKLRFKEVSQASLALLARRADRATSSNVAKHPLSEAGGGSNSTEYSGTGPTTPPHDAKEASQNFLGRGLPLLARRGAEHPQTLQLSQVCCCPAIAPRSNTSSPESGFRNQVQKRRKITGDPVLVSGSSTLQDVRSFLAALRLFSNLQIVEGNISTEAAGSRGVALADLLCA